MRDGASAKRLALLVVSIPLALGTAARNREYESSLTLARTAVERYPSSAAHHVLAVELIAAGRHAEAMEHLYKALPGAPRAYFTLGVECYSQGQWDKAIEYLQTFVRQQPLMSEAVTARQLIGGAFAKEERWPEAVDQFRAVLRMNPLPDQQAETQLSLADALLRLRAFDEALSYYRAYLYARPADVGALTNAGIALGQLNRLDDAIVTFRRAVEIEPRNALAQRNLANALLFDGRHLDEATVHARQAVSLNPADAAAHDVLGRALAAEGQVAAAIIQFQQALGIDPNTVDVREHLADAVRLQRRSAPSAF